MHPVSHTTVRDTQVRYPEGMDGRIVDLRAEASWPGNTPREEEADALVPSSPVALFASGSNKVTPEALRRSLRRRGVLDLSVFAACFGAALGVSGLVGPGALGWLALLYVSLLILPAVILHRMPPQRCPACATLLEVHHEPEGDDGLPHSTTFCPACEVGVE